MTIVHNVMMITLENKPPVRWAVDRHLGRELQGGVLTGGQVDTPGFSAE